MTTFNYTGSALSNLTGGTPGANVSNLVQLLNDLKTFLNGANLDATNIAPVADTLLASPTNGVWRTVIQLDFRGGITGLSTTPCYVGGTGILTSGGAGGAAISGLWVPPTASDIAVAGKTTRLRLRVSYATNATAPGINLSWNLYPITSLAGGANLIIPTLGTLITGSTAFLTAPTSGSAAEVKSSSFDFSAVTGSGTGAYAIGVVGSAAQAANSLLACTAFLEMRHT